MCDIADEFAVWLKRKMWLRSINRFRDQGVMSPKNAVLGAGPWPCGMATTRTAVSGGSGALVSSVGAIPLPTAPRPQRPQATELLRLIILIRTQSKAHIFVH